jgi:hypothetical protein|tara:strand:- start:643 stop:1881 length:1239 start_codon:yes stop_codon:yes gene_type:complete
MPTPNGGLITETNQQYYEGAQGFLSTGDDAQVYTTTFDTNLVFGDWNPANANYALNNFKLYTSTTGLPQTYTEYLLAYTVTNNVIDITPSLPAGTFVVVQLKILTGGKYGQTEAEKAYGQTVEDNYNSYSYVTLEDIINNFLVAYVGVGKLIQSVQRTDVIFHAKRGLQEFSYDTLKSIHSQELNIPASLNVVIPQDYVNYVSVSWIDQLGVKRPIYPANNLTTSPYETPIQDQLGIPTNDNFGENIEGTSITEERWKRANDNLLNGQLGNNVDQAIDFQNQFGFEGSWNWGRQYGLDPQLAQTNGWFNINEREGKMSFSSNLVGKLIVLEYISDGLAYELDTRVPKMAEDAMYAYVVHAILSTRVNQPEYIVQRLQKDKRAKLRNAKIRLSNIKLDEIVQVMRGKSKWIKS